MTPVPRLRAYDGPVILSYGFRPFFFFGALYAGIAILAWLPMFYGELALPTSFAPRDWHIHEMLYGYVPAIMTGFLLTAIPNWTGRLPLQGAPLLILVTTWVAGRVAVSASGLIGWLPAATIDSAFLILVAAAAAREIIAGRNWRNLRIVLVVAVLAAGNIAFHVEAHFTGLAEYSLRLGIAAVITLLILVGGRIIPSFTNNWLVRQGPGRLPTPFNRFDAIAIAVGVLGLLLWVTLPDGPLTAALLFLAATVHTIRLSRWAGERTWRERLLLVLHVGYAFVPLGFALIGLAALHLVLASAGMHALMVGAAGTMTLAVMSRASLGHAGRPLTASWPTQLIYAAVLVAAMARICAALEPGSGAPLLHVAAAAWAAAFLGFATVYAPVLWRPKAL
jgi:uncharacterized protein involved in response to NO